MNATDIKNGLTDLDVAIDTVLPLAGQAELVPLVDLVTKILGKLTDAIASKGAAAPTLAVEVAAADAAADAAERAKFPPK